MAGGLLAETHPVGGGDDLRHRAFRSMTEPVLPAAFTEQVPDASRNEVTSSTGL